MSSPAAELKPSLYEQDFHAWVQEQVRLLRAGRLNELDLGNVVEELESLGRSHQHQIEDRMVVLLKHLLKWQFQPEGRCGSWKSSISEQRRRIATVVRDSPSLKRLPGTLLGTVYNAARREASDETEMPLSAFPATSPYTADQALDFEFLPE